MERTEFTFCRICEASCGLEVTVEDGRVTRIRPDQDHVTTEGFACFKGVKAHKLYDSPDRLRTPMRRNGRGFEEVGWDAALAGIGARVRRIVDRHGPDSVAMYVGTAAGFGVLHPIFAQGLMTGIGSRSMYSSATQDCSNKFAVAREMYGFPFTQPFPDLEHCNHLVIVGANPVVSKWSFLQVSNPKRRIEEISERGGRVVVVDPRLTETARVADEHVFIRPGTDVFFYLSFLNELLACGHVDTAGVERHMRGFETLADLAGPWTPERTQDVTGIDAPTLRRLVQTYGSADGAAIYSSTGVNMGGHGAVAFWLQEAVNAVSGNLDRRGGTLVGRGLVDFPKFGKRTGTLLREDRTRIGGFPSVNDAFPGGVLADEILTPGPGQVRALFVTGGNPLLTMANSGRLREAFADLDLLVTLDIFLNETGSVADYVLPTTSPLQRPDLPFVFPLMLGLQMRPWLQATPRIVEPEGEQRDEATIYMDLARACGVSLFGSKPVQVALETASEFRRRRHGRREVPQEALLGLLLRLGGGGGFGRLARHRHGVRRPAHRSGTFLGERVYTSDGRVDLAPPALVERVPSLEEPPPAPDASEGRFLLITKRHTKTHNSWTHNHPEFVAGDHDRNHLYVHSEDADRLGVKGDDTVDVSSETATVRLPVRILDDLMPGVVALPHGWGHQGAEGLATASSTPGVNVNLLAADGPKRIEPLSGMAHLTGIRVTVRPAAGPQDTSSWSGLPAD